ncbi:Inhibitor of growth protein 5 [Toxocara canis]|uniref:Inhibitor of growth protein n=1 Tax=Toxocara canis TaxID=6265 RepID=A0A0B2VLV6_TOXCA|nr:Inhibitor of growth protein 5 [Toxocara canis]
MSQFLEQYHKSVADLPDKLKEHFQEIGRLDAECMAKAALADVKMQEFVKNRKSLSKTDAEALHKEITGLFIEMHRLSDQKIRLSSDAYELVDRQIRKLDDDAAKLRASMHQKFIDAAGKITAAGDESEGEMKKRKLAHRKDKKKEDSKSVTDASGSTAVLQPFLDTTPIVEMPVDPNEPTYCICHQVSFGEMVMCDNKQCPIEWFHFQCVGLMEPPKGKWYCERCAEQRKKKNTATPVPKKH